MTDQLASGGLSLQAKSADRVIPFGKYLLVDRIAVGGMAEVYTAKSFGVEGFEKILAIKRILPTMAEDQDFIQMFINEAKIAGQLTHANICPIYELGKIGESHYIAMEYVWGKDLLQIMNRFRKMRKQMPPSMAAWIVAKMCEGLDYAHRKKDRNGKPLTIIHRDVSPQNCLVSYEGQVKMIDFGIAKAASNTTKTQAGVLKGKFGYMSPEQVRGLPVDHRSDIFAVGTCLYEMLTTERLFVGESDFSTLEKVRNAQVPPLSLQVPDVPKELEEIVMKALSRDVDDRWQTAADMQEALQRFIARERPPFGTSKVAAWMRTAFAPEMAKEKVRIDAFAKIGPPAPPPPPARPSAPSHDDEPEELAGEATVMSASPYDSLVDGGAHEAAEIQEQATQIFFSADEDEEATGAANLKMMAPAAAPKAAPPAVVQAPPRPVGLPPPSVRTFGPPGGPRSAAQQSTLPQGMPGVQAGAPMINAPQGAPPPQQMQQMQMQQQQMQMQQQQQQQMQMQQQQMQQQQQQAFANQPVNPLGQTVEGRAPFASAPEAQMQGGFAQPAPRGRTDTMQIEVPQEKKKSRGVLYAFLGVGTLGTLAAAAAALFFMFGRGPEVGTIEVRTVPPEAATAEILLDGVPRGNAPVRLDNVPIGPHILVLRHPGFREETRPISVNANGTSSLDVAMTAAVAVAAVAAPVPVPVPVPVAAAPVAVAPEAAVATAVAVDPAVPAAPPAPEPAAQVAAPAPAPVPAPTPAPVAVAPTPAPTPAPAARAPAPTPAPTPAPARTATPAPAPARQATPAPAPTPAPARATPTRRAEPAPAPEPAPAATPSRRPTRVTAAPAAAAPARAGAAGQGTLLIQTIPWARVIIDGRDTGRNTPVRDLRVSAGSHRIGLRTADGNTTEITVEVTPNEVTRVVRQL